MPRIPYYQERCKMSTLTLAEIKAEVAHIKEIATDDESAHGAEDRLYREVLAHIGLHSTDAEAREMARAALFTQDIEFARRCS